jgi:polyferredoxin
MYCENCGNPIKTNNSFCVNCGAKASEATHKNKELENKSWYRFAKVVYTFFYFFLFVALYFVFTENSQTYNYSGYGSGSYTYDYGNGIWIAFLTLLFGSIFFKLVKVSFVYIITGSNPNWKQAGT